MGSTLDFSECATVKLKLLANGINYDEPFQRWYASQSHLLEKRRAYGDADQVLRPAAVRVPQEIILDDRLVTAVNYSPESPWHLRQRDATKGFVTDGTDEVPIAFVERPSFYGVKLENGTPLERLATLYGNGTLGLFSPGHCYYFNDNRECRFCSLGPTRKQQAAHQMAIRPDEARAAVKKALEVEGTRVRHILLNGGTIPDYDRGFEQHLLILEAIADLGLPDGVQLHLISMPPMNFKLFDRLAATGATIAMDIEIYDPVKFAEICPGKDQDYTRVRFMDAYEAGVAALGKGRVYCGLVAGMEPLETLLEGIATMGERGAVPAVNVFHPDPSSKFAKHSRPSVEYLDAVLRGMAKTYAAGGYVPFIEGSGRNSLDTEAYIAGSRLTS